MPSKGAHYAPLSQHDVDEGKSVDADSPIHANEPISPLAVQSERRPKEWIHTLHYWEWVTRGALSLLALAFFVLWITSAGAPKCTYVAKYCERFMYAYARGYIVSPDDGDDAAPVNEAIEYIERFKYNGVLYFQTPWRGDDAGNPSPDIDAAWRRISTDVKPICITGEQARKMGMEVTPTTVTFSKEEGGSYPASLEVTHHLQCLDMLRKATYREYYASFDPAFQTEDETLMNQLDTCVELLRQDLMCYPDLNLVALYWLHGRKSPFPDNNSMHRCKNFEKILDWVAERAVNVPRLGGLRARETDGPFSGTRL